LIQIQSTISKIRAAQLDLFNEHLQLESVPGDALDLKGFVEQESADESVDEAHFIPLADWFNTKEKSLEQLTTHLEEICVQMSKLNESSKSSVL